jgi:hypothetical protein
MSAIKRGMKVTTATADGQRLDRRAVSGVEEEGHDFPVVWVTTEDEWVSSEGNGHQPDAWPWPAEDVKPG